MSIPIQSIGKPLRFRDGTLLKRFAWITFALCLLPSGAIAQNAGYWSGVDRKFATTQFSNVAAVAAHNCYVDDGVSAQDSLQKTLARVHAAQAGEADLIELDIRATGNEIFVAHDDDGQLNCAKLIDVLKDPALVAGDQVVFIEVKEERPTARFARAILQHVVDSGVAKTGRPIVFRAFDDKRRNLTLIQSVLGNPIFEKLKPNVRLHEFIRSDGSNDHPAVHKKILRAKESGFDGVEFRFDMPNVFAAIGYAKSLGLGVGVFTIPERFGEVFVAALREDVDALVVDYPVSKTRSVIEAKNGLVYLNTRSLERTSKTVKYFSSDPDHQEFEIRTLRSPILKTADSGSPFFGTAMVFSSNRSATLFDADNQKDEGYLVSACVGFTDLNLHQGETRSVFAKSDSGGFALELHNPDGPESTSLRFGVMVGDSYRYANYPATNLNTTDSYFIVAGYDGDGSVRMWINGSDEDVATTAAIGAVRQNDSPAVIGADPQGETAKRFYFRGVIQQIQLQSWGAH